MVVTTSNTEILKVEYLVVCITPDVISR